MCYCSLLDEFLKLRLGAKWHPTKPVIISVSDNGLVYIWGTTTADRWAAYAADFEELDENQEYLEKVGPFLNRYNDRPVDLMG